jgi:hypothetical protein
MQGGEGECVWQLAAAEQGLGKCEEQMNAVGSVCSRTSFWSIIMALSHTHQDL